METYKSQMTQTQSEIFRLLCINAGEKLNQRQIALSLKISPTAIANSVKELEKRGLVTRKKQNNMNLVLVELNRDNEKAIRLKRVENLKMIYETELVNYLADEIQGSTIILFGSFSRGDDTSSSDIDIAIIGRTKKEIDLSKFEKILSKEIILNFYNKLTDLKKELKENICNGIVLSGGIEL